MRRHHPRPVAGGEDLAQHGHDLGEALGGTGRSRAASRDGHPGPTDLVEQRGPGPQVREPLLPGQAVGAGAVEEDGPDDVAAAAATAPRWVASWWKYMSSWVAAAEQRLQRAEGGTELDGLGVHDRSSAAHTREEPWVSTSRRARRRVIGRWVCRLTRPGMTVAAGVDHEVAAGTAVA